MSPDQRARALRLADELDADGAAYAATYKFQHRLLMEAADLLRELAAEPERVPLTQEQIDAITSVVDWKHGGGDDWATPFCRAVEHAHGIGGN